MTISFLFIKRLLLIVLSIFSTSIFAYDIIINKNSSILDSRYQYSYDLINLIIEATPDYGPLNIRTSNFYMSRDRALVELKLGNLINVMAEAPKPEWDNSLIVIPIPIRKGIQGLRVFITNNKNASLIKNAKSLEEFKGFSTGSGVSWSTRVAMENAGFDVITGSNYDGLFGMLSKDRFSTFGRGINEIYKELATWKDKYPNLVVDSNVLLQIPLATYFYVSPKAPEIAQRIKVGLLRLIENGSFEQFFYKRHCKYLLKAQINNCKVFHIPNNLASTKRMLSIVDENFLIDTNTNFSEICQ